MAGGTEARPLFAPHRLSFALPRDGRRLPSLSILPPPPGPRPAGSHPSFIPRLGSLSAETRPGAGGGNSSPSGGGEGQQPLGEAGVKPPPPDALFPVSSPAGPSAGRGPGPAAASPPCRAEGYRGGPGAEERRLLSRTKAKQPGRRRLERNGSRIVIAMLEAKVSLKSLLWATTCSPFIVQPAPLPRNPAPVVDSWTWMTNPRRLQVCIR